MRRLARALTSTRLRRGPWPDRPRSGGAQCGGPRFDASVAGCGLRFRYVKKRTHPERDRKEFLCVCAVSASSWTSWRSVGVLRSYAARNCSHPTGEPGWSVANPPVLPASRCRRYPEVMPEAVTTESIPLVTGADGVMRVRGTRVTLDIVLAAFREGATAEEIAQQYPSVSLADVYQVIGYYLRHSSELEPYLEQRGRKSREVRAANESKWPPECIRDRLLARRQT